MIDKLKILEREVATVLDTKILLVEYTDSDRDIVSVELKGCCGFSLTRNQTIEVIDEIKRKLVKVE